MINKDEAGENLHCGATCYIMPLDQRFMANAQYIDEKTKKRSFAI